MSDQENITGTGNLFAPLGQIAGVGHVRFSARGELTAGAMSNASVSFDDKLERADWDELPQRLAQLDIAHLRMLADMTEPVIPKLCMLTKWRPRVASEQVVKLAAASVLSEKIAAREHLNKQIVAWIGAAAVVIAAVAAFLLGRWTV